MQKHEVPEYYQEVLNILNKERHRVKHVIVIETPRIVNEDDIQTILRVIQRIFNAEGEITCSFWNQHQAPLSVPNATDTGETRLADI